MEKMSEILQILEEQVINKTLNLEGIAHVQKIVDENKSLKQGNDAFAKQLKDKSNELAIAYEDLVDVKQKLSAANKELTEYKAKDKEFYEQSVMFKYEQQRGNELKEIVGMALRNPVITESRFGGKDGDNGMYQSHNDTTTRTVD